MSRRFQCSVMTLLVVLIGATAAGATTQQIALSMRWNDGKETMSLSPQGNALFFLLGTGAGFVATLLALSGKPPE